MTRVDGVDLGILSVDWNTLDQVAWSALSKALVQVVYSEPPHLSKVEQRLADKIVFSLKVPIEVSRLFDLPVSFEVFPC